MQIEKYPAGGTFKQLVQAKGMAGSAAEGAQTETLPVALTLT